MAWQQWPQRWQSTSKTVRQILLLPTRLLKCQSANCCEKKKHTLPKNKNKQSNEAGYTFSSSRDNSSHWPSIGKSFRCEAKSARQCDNTATQHVVTVTFTVGSQLERRKCCAAIMEKPARHSSPTAGECRKRRRGKTNAFDMTACDTLSPLQRVEYKLLFYAAGRLLLCCHALFVSMCRGGSGRQSLSGNLRQKLDN